MLVDHVRAGKAKQARALHRMPQGMRLPGVELRCMLDLCLYFIPAHRLKARPAETVGQLCAKQLHAGSAQRASAPSYDPHLDLCAV